MALKSYSELRKIDITPYIEKRDGADYLNWAMCKELLHENGAQTVYFEPVTNENGSSLFMTAEVFTDKNGITNRCYEVEVKIVIDDLVFNMRAPLMNGSNPVKDNSMSQQRVWNAQTRAFVKGVAIRTGLGFGLWLDDVEGKVAEEDLSKHKLSAIRQRFQELYTQKLQKQMSSEDIAKALDMTTQEVKAVFAQFDTLERFEERLRKI